VSLVIGRLGHHGDGVADTADGPVFVPGTLPGEVVAGVVENGRMAAPRILTPSPDRVRPPCPHVRSCGGCLLQHASDSFVAGWKVGLVATALAARGVSAPVRGLHVSPPRSRRRATLAVRRGRSGVTVGFHARGSDAVVATPECHLLHPALMAGFPAFEAIAAPALSRKGTLALTVTLTDTGLDVAAQGGKPLDAALRADLAALAEAHGLARLTWDGTTVAQRVAPVVQFGRARVPLPPGGFLQATAEGEAALLAAVRAALRPVLDARGRVADLFAGCGTFALPLAESVEVQAAESDPAATAALLEGWRRAPGLRAVAAETRDLFRRPLAGAELRGLDAAVIDPPRAGAAAQTAALAAARVPLVVALSCNPVTFARDAQTLVAAGYRLDWVAVVDQFRWSPHVELAARFALPHIAGE
jgi:23S rRNA (uracil1939-C5)-methyltransferase